MKLVSLRIKNFRGFRAEREVAIGDLTAFVGRNDAGKSTILEALDVFLNGKKVDFRDANALSATGEAMRIACCFGDLPATLTLDAQALTTLAGEYLLNSDGNLEVAMDWPIEVTAPLPDRAGKLGKPSHFCLAQHPTNQGVADLLQKKQAELRKLVSDLGIQADVNQASNVSMHAGLWRYAELNGGLALAQRAIPVDKEDAKQILERIRESFPAFELFRADRASTDEDDEVQDPMRLAIAAALQEVSVELEAIRTKVRERAIEVANRTLAKLHDFDSALASQLTPGFRSEQKWDSLFKLSLTGDDGITVNKRGSGVRRLVLFSFFRAEVERRRVAAGGAGAVIYAVEEPETAQHPHYQRVVVEALAALSEEANVQVMFTTHVPALIGLVPPAAIRYVQRTGTGADVEAGSPTVYDRVATDLGVLPSPQVAPTARLALCVEGKHDIQFLNHICGVLVSEDPTVVDIRGNPKVVTVPLGGSILQDWVDEQYLRALGLREFHIYDRDVARPDGSVKYEAAAAQVNARPTGDVAVLTTMREMEAYLHPDAICEAFQQSTLAAAVNVIATDQNDVPTEVTVLTGRTVVDRRSVKHWLNDNAAARMTPQRLRDRGAHSEILGWFRTIGSFLT